MTSKAVLVLNASWEPLPDMIPVNDAVCAVIGGKADIIEFVEGEYFRSQYLSIPAPTVILLKRYVKLPFRRRTLAVTSQNVLERDMHICGYCGGPADSMDHIVPTSRGGRNEWMNVIAACIPCNSRKDNTLLEDTDMTLRFSPTIPLRKSWLVVGWKDREQQAKYIPEHMEV
jgi:hypothetical protein